MCSLTLELRGLFLDAKQRLAHLVAGAVARCAAEREHVISRRKAGSRQRELEAPGRCGFCRLQTLAIQDLRAADGVQRDSVLCVVVLLQIQFESDLLGSGGNLERGRKVIESPDASDGEDQRDDGR